MGNMPAQHFLGMRVQQDMELGTIQLTQKPYWEHVINRFNLDGITPQNVPLPTRIILNSNMSPKMDSERKAMDDKPYHPILGSIMWGQLATRFQANPGIEHVVLCTTNDVGAKLA